MKARKQKQETPEIFVDDWQAAAARRIAKAGIHKLIEQIIKLGKRKRK
jgi:hypothetical protein